MRRSVPSPGPADGPGGPGGPGGPPARALIRISPRGRRLAALLGRHEGLRLRRQSTPVPARPDWVEAWIRTGPLDTAVLDLLALGPEVEVLRPPELRHELAGAARRIAALHAAPEPGPGAGSQRLTFDIK
ncbi:MAG TPA: WYL domain-containing protein [Streptosporangiaceae bacterium]